MGALWVGIEIGLLLAVCIDSLATVRYAVMVHQGKFSELGIFGEDS